MHILVLFFTLLFLTLLVGISLMTLRFAMADLATQWMGQDRSLRVYLSDIFALITLFSAASSAILLVNRSDSPRAVSVAVAALLALMMWMFSVWLLSQSKVNHPTKRLAFCLVSGPATLFVVANWSAIFAVGGSMITDENGRQLSHLATLVVMQASIVPIRYLNEWIASPDEMTSRPRPPTLAEIEKRTS